MNISTNLCQDDFNVSKVLSQNIKAEVLSANVPFCPMVVIKRATTEANAESAILNEIQLLTKIKHQNIIAIRGARVTATKPFIGTHTYIYTYIHHLCICASLSVVLEELCGGTLSDMIERRKGRILPRWQALDIARQLACALQHLQEELSPFAMIIHRGILLATSSC